jgi:hypothetical protein
MDPGGNTLRIEISKVNLKVNLRCGNRVAVRSKEIQTTYHLLTSKLLQDPSNRSHVTDTPRGRLHPVRFESSKI